MSISTSDFHKSVLLDSSASQASSLETSGSDENTSLIDVLTIIGARKKWIAKVTAGVALCTVVLTLLLPNRYTATVVILPPQHSSSSATALLSQIGGLGALASLGSLGSSGGFGIKDINEMYVSLLKSRTVQDALVKRFDLMRLYGAKRQSDAREALERHCKIELGIKDGLIRLSVEDSQPGRAAELANAYIDEYKKFSADLATTEAAQRRLFFEEQLADAKNKLAVAEEALKESEQKTRMIHLDSQAKVLIESVAQLRAQIAAKEIQLRAMQTAETTDNPEILVLKEQLAAMQAQAKQLGGSTTDDDMGLIVPEGKLPTVGLEYIRKLRDVKYYETIFEILARQFEAAKLDEAKQGAVIQVVDAAVVPDRKSFPKRGIIVIVSTLVAFMLAAMWTLVAELIRRQQRDPQEAEKYRLLRQMWRVRTKRA